MARPLTAGAAAQAPLAPEVRALRRARDLDAVGAAVLRLGLAFLLALFGALKFFRFQAEALEPLVRQSPLVAWMYVVFGVRTAAMLMGSVEVVAAVGLLIGPRWPVLGAVGGALASARASISLTFVLTAHAVPLSPGFFLKDLVLLGAALQLTAGFLLARRVRPVALAQPIRLPVRPDG